MLARNLSLSIKLYLYFSFRMILYEFILTNSLN